MFKDNEQISSFRQWNHRLRKIVETEDDWDKELGFLSELNGQFGVRYTGAQRTLTLNDEESEEE